jgi:dTDP-4-amino-4,6-dideoxygalactose transaminase
MEVLPDFLKRKRLLAEQYQTLFSGSNFQFVSEPEYANSNYWLNAIICPDADSRNLLLKETNEQGVMTRPIWQLMHRLPMFKNSLKGDLKVSQWLEAHLINIPSSPIALG